MALYYLIAVFLIFAEFFGQLPSQPIKWIPGISGARAAGLLVIAFAFQLSIIYYAATHHSPYANWENALPLKIVPNMGSMMSHQNWLSAAFTLLSIISTAVLFALWKNYQKEQLSAKPVLIGAILMGALSLAAPALTSADIYANIGYSMLGSHSYRPPNYDFSGSFAVINRWWGTPMVPSPYGPLWLGIIRLQEAGATSLLQKLITFRMMAFGEFLAFLLTLRYLGFGAPIVAIAALNPALWLQFVVDGHNDGLAIVLIAAAFILVRKHLLMAAACIIAAGLIKAPYAFIGLLAFVTVNPPLKRYLVTLLTFVGTAGLSAKFGGAEYVAAITTHVASWSSMASLLHALTWLLAIIILLWALVAGPKIQNAIFVFPALGAALFPWYLIWSFPYAFLKRAYLAALIISFPLACTLMVTVFYIQWYGLLVFLFGAFCVFNALRTRAATAAGSI